jgi:hypothetical protein
VAVAGVLSGIALLLVQCSPKSEGITPSGGGSGGKGGANVPDASAGGSKGDVIVPAVNLDVIPVSWITSDVPQGPEVVAAPSIDANCGLLASETVRKPADVLLVLDASLSMNWSIAEDNCYCSSSLGNPVCTTTPCTSRLDDLKPPLSATLTNSTYVNWGLETFPTGGSGSCTVSTTMPVPVAANSAANIQKQLDSLQLILGTPTALALKNATAYLKSLNDGNKKFILLATDGEPNCGGNPASVNNDDVAGATAAAKDAYNNGAGYPVYVIGIGPNPGNLTQIAAAGGTTDFYPVTSPDQLVQALSTITKVVGSCTFTSAKEPEDPDNVAVYVNKERIDKSEDNGWTYGDTTQDIKLTGSYCDAITAGEDTAVQIIFGCPGSPPFPTTLF